jgi:RimJ/RimL family protein N-acetyltransferase
MQPSRPPLKNKATIPAPIETPRRLLRPFTLSDADEIHPVYADPRVLKHIDGSRRPGRPRRRDSELSASSPASANMALASGKSARRNAAS